MKKSIVLLLHVFYWFRLPPVLFTLVTDQFQLSGSFIFYNILPNISQVVAFYVAYLLLFPYLLARKKVFKFIIAALLTLMVALAAGWLAFWCFTWAGYRELPPQLSDVNTISFFLFLGPSMSGVFFGCLLKAFVSWYADIRVKEALKQKAVQTELALLKSQLNPHFLFNTLNNIDTMIAQDPDTASHYLNELSDILRFALYESSEEKIQLGKEIEYIEKYVALQRIRTNNSSFVNFTVTGEYTGRQIAPLLFIPFIENAFKHSANKKKEHAIDIRIVVDGARLQFNCENVISEKPLPLNQGGIGIDNIRSRLALIYPKHVLDIRTVDNIYKVSLQLDLHEY